MPYPLPNPELRFLKARLKPFTKPMFWGSATILTLLGVAIWQYWQHPEWSATNDIEQPSAIKNNTANQNFEGVVVSPDSSQQLSQEDLAIAADIDNSELLLEELQSSQVPVNLLPPQTEVEKNSQNDFLNNQNKSDNSLTNELNQTQQNPFTPNPSLINPTSNTPSNNNNNINFKPPRSVFNAQNFGSNRPVNYLERAMNQQNNNQPTANQITENPQPQPQQTPTYTGYNSQITNNSNELSRNRSFNYPNYSYSNSYRDNVIPPPSPSNSNFNNYNSYNNQPQNNYQQFRPSITTSTGVNNDINPYGNPSNNQSSTGTNSNFNNQTSFDQDQQSTVQQPNNNTSNNNSNFPTFSESTDFNNSAFDNTGFVGE